MGHGLFWDPAVHWGFQIAVYLFLGGLAGGSYITGYVADVLSTRTAIEEEYVARRETARWGMYVAVASIGVGGIALLTHLGVPLRALYFPLTFTNYGSWMVIGTWAIIIFTLWTFGQAFWYTFGGAIEGEAGTSLVFRHLLSKYVRMGGRAARSSCGCSTPSRTSPGLRARTGSFMGRSGRASRPC